jgi:hypothetical protein
MVVPLKEIFTNGRGSFVLESTICPLIFVNCPFALMLINDNKIKLKKKNPFFVICILKNIMSNNNQDVRK